MYLYLKARLEYQEYQSICNMFRKNHSSHRLNIIEIYYSKYDESFINSAKIFFGNNIKLTKHEI